MNKIKFPYKTVILGFIVMMTGIVWLSVLIGDLRKTEYPVYNKTNTCYDMVWGGISTSTAPIWIECKTGKLHFNLEKVCIGANEIPESTSPTTTIYTFKPMYLYRQIEWTGTNPCK